MALPRSEKPIRTVSLFRSDLSAKHIMLPVLLVLSACGSGDDDGGGADSAPAVEIAAAIDVSEGDTSAYADTVDTQTLQQTAARNAAQGITANLSGAQRLNGSRTTVLADASDPSAELFEDASSLFSNRIGEQLFSDGADLGIALIDTSSLEVFDGLLDASADEQTNLLVEATLGLGENDDAMVQRQGNTILVDPDDVALCQAVQMDQEASSSEIASCQQLVSNLTVQIDAVTEQRGEITYLYSNQPLLTIAYGPLNAAYTLNLGTLHQMAQYADQLAGVTQSDDSVQQMLGSVRLQARVFNSIDGQESGNVRLEIVEGLRVTYTDGSSLSMAPSLLMSMEHDDAAGTASVEMALGATQLQGSASKPGSMSFSGFTARMTMDETAGLLNVSDLGFVGGPLHLSDDGFSANIALQGFAFAFEEQTEQLVFNSALNMILSATSTDPDFGNAHFSFALSGPAGTRIDNSADSESATTVLSGGPLHLEYSVAAGSEGETGYVSWSAGSCQSGTSVPQDQSFIDSLVDC